MESFLRGIQSIDLEILLFIQKYFTNDFMDKLMVFITKLGDNGLIWIGIAICLLISSKYTKVGFMVLIALSLSMLLSEIILKDLIGRLRPFEYVENIVLLIDKPTSYSFPSGHTASSFAAATILAYYFKRYKVWIFALAGVIAFSRLYLFVHNPTDIVAGIALGVFCGSVVVKIFLKIKSSKKEHS